MRRSRTPATAWPAVADLMTILAVIGLTAAAVVGNERNSRIDELIRQVEERDDSIAGLEDRIDELEESMDNEIGFTPCWRGGAGEKRFFVTYEVTFANGRYSVSKHRDFLEGIRKMAGATARVKGALEGVPAGEIGEAALLEFGDAVSDAIGRFYRDDCRLAVTINTEVTGGVIARVNRAGFYTLYR